MGGNSRRNSISGGPRGVVSWAGGITRSVDTPYGGLLIPTSADKKAGRAFVKFAAKLFSERASHASAGVDEEGVDRANSPIVQAEPGESWRISEQCNHRFCFNTNSACAEFGQLLGAQCKHAVGEESDVLAPVREKHCRL
jgi:hypothetical protein